MQGTCSLSEGGQGSASQPGLRAAGTESARSAALSGAGLGGQFYCLAGQNGRYRAGADVVPAAEGQTVSHLAQAVSMELACQKSERTGVGRAGWAGSALCVVWWWCFWSGVRGAMAGFSPPQSGAPPWGSAGPSHPSSTSCPWRGFPGCRVPGRGSRGAAAELPAWCTCIFRLFLELIKYILERFMPSSITGRQHQ